MKKIFLLSIALALLVGGSAYAYTVKSGDTVWHLANESNTTVNQIVEWNGIEDADYIYVGQELDLGLPFDLIGATPTPTSSANRMYVEAPDMTLYGGAIIGDTTITLDNAVDIYNNDLSMTYFGDKGYARINPNGDNISEAITFTGMTANTDGTFTLTGVKTALAKYPYTETSGLVRSHAIGSIVRFTNTAGFYNDLANKENDEIIDGTWTFSSSFPIVSSTSYTGLPTNNGDLATKYYVDTVGAGGFTATNVSTTHATEALGTSPEQVGVIVSSTKGMFSGSDSEGIYQKVSSTLGLAQDSNGIYIKEGNYVSFDSSGNITVDATSTPTADKIVIASSTGEIADGWLSETVKTKTVISMTAGESTDGATTPVAVFVSSTDSEVYVCDGNDTDKMKYIGFAITSSSDGNPITVQTQGIVSGFTGLTTGTKYYVADDKTVSSTVGTYEVLVGISISETEIMVQKGSRYASGYITISSTATTIITTGFRISKVSIFGSGNTTGSGQGTIYSSGGWTNYGGNDCLYRGDDAAGLETGSAWNLQNPTGGDYHRGVINNITDTTFSIANTKTGSATESYLYWEAIGEF